jgi:hypothetical protein
MGEVESDSVGTTLFERLAGLGYDDSYLDKTGQFGYITVRKNPEYGAYEPALGRKYEKNNLFPVSWFLKLGDKLLFPADMKNDVGPPLDVRSSLRMLSRQPIFGLLAAIVAFGCQKFGYLPALNRMSFLEGAAAYYSNPPFETFPFDQWLTITGIATTWLVLREPDGTQWEINCSVLTDPKSIRVMSLVPG